MYTNPGNGQNEKNDRNDQSGKMQYTFTPSYTVEHVDNSRYENRYAGEQQAPPPGKKRRTGLVALMMVMCLVCTLVGGVGGGYIATYVNNQSYSQNAGDQGGSLLPDSTPAVSPAQVSQNSGKSYTTSEIYSLCNSAVVAISTETTRYNVFGQAVQIPAAGSGFIITDDGYIVTNAHVISGASKITVYLYDGTGYEAKLVGKDEDNDLAVLKIEKTGLKYVLFGDSEALSVGDPVVAIGNPLGELNNSLSAGCISALDRAVNIEGTPMTMLQTDAAISPGNSGGPLFNGAGEVIGVVSAKSVSSGAEGIGFAIPSSHAKAIVEQLMEHGYVQGKPQLGIMVDTSYTSAAAKYYNMPEGAYVSTVNEGGCAEKAGMQVGDVIVRLGGSETKDMDALQAALRKFKAGDQVEVIVNRQGTEITLNVTLDEKRDVQETQTQQGANERTNPRDPFGIYGYKEGQNGGGA